MDPVTLSLLKTLGPAGTMVCIVAMLWSKVKYLEAKVHRMSNELQPISQCKLMHHNIEEKVTMFNEQILEDQKDLKRDIRDLRDKIDENQTKILEALSKKKE